MIVSRRELMKVAVGFAAAPTTAQAETVLPGTTRWSVPTDLVAEQYREFRNFLDERIALAARTRRAGTREQFRTSIGAIDSFDTPQPKSEALGEDHGCTATLVSWQLCKLGTLSSTGGGPAGAAVHLRGVVLQPKTAGPWPAVILIPDANESAADAAGLTGKATVAQQLVRSGFVVFALLCIQRRNFIQPWCDDRRWLFRLAYLTGHHLIGSEVQQVSSAVDYLKTLNIDPNRITVAGAGQGGLTAFYAAAIDERIPQAIVVDYFDSRDHAYEEPEDRTVWNLLSHFGDAEIALLIAPRKLTLICNTGPARLRRVRAELARVPDRANVSVLENSSIADALAANVPGGAANSIIVDPMRIASLSAQQFTEWQARFHNLALESYRVRESRWQADTRSPAAYKRSIQRALDEYKDALGRFPSPDGSFDAQSEMLSENPSFRSFRLQVRVYKDVHVCGILLVPHSANASQRRPTVFAVHGFQDLPEDVVNRDRLYHRFAAKLAERGYVVFAPMISVQDGAERSGLVRRAHLLGATPVGLEVVKFQRALDFLSTLPFVDPARFAIYGLSYGGYTALRIGAAEPRFQVVISSGDFNETTLKNASLTEGTSFLFHGPVFDRYIFGWLNRFSDSVVARLIAPRAFMAEIGDSDPVMIEPRRFLDMELQMVADTYRQLGLPERMGVARFAGPHEIHGAETFEFLDRMLEWKPAA